MFKKLKTVLAKFRSKPKTQRLRNYLEFYNTVSIGAGMRHQLDRRSSRDR